MVEIISSLERDALTMAYIVHAGQRRKYTNEPYITHPIAVGGILKDCGIVDPEVIAAAILHDTIEDTSLRYNDIHQGLGKRVADLVLEVTDVSNPEHGNRAARKAIDRAHLAKASVDGKNIKLADLIHNTASIVRHDPNFAKTYLEEKRLLLEVLTDGNSALFCRAVAQIAGTRTIDFQPVPPMPEGYAGFRWHLERQMMVLVGKDMSTLFLSNGNWVPLTTEKDSEV